MEKNEFQYFVINPSDILTKGRNAAVTVDSQGRITLTSGYPIAESGPFATCAGVTVDSLGDIYVLDGASGHIYRQNYKDTARDKIPCIGGFGRDACTFQFSTMDDPDFQKLMISVPDAGIIALTNHYVVQEGKQKFYHGNFCAIAVSKQFIAISDCGNSRIQCFFRDSLQISCIITSNSLRCLGIQGQGGKFTPWDCVIDSFGDLYVLDIHSSRLIRISQRGHSAAIMGASCFHDPVSLFLDQSDDLYVLDRGNNTVFKKHPGPDDEWHIVVNFEKFVRHGRKVLGLALDYNKSIFIGECGKNTELLFHIWNNRGEYTGNFNNPYGNCRRIIAGKDGTLYAECADRGVVAVNGHQGYVREGYFFSRIFDSGFPQTAWHRIIADADLCSGTHIGIDYISSERHLGDPWLIDQTLWKTAFDLDGDGMTAPDCLLSHIIGRYLALRIRFQGNGDCTPTLRRIRILFPSATYLRYLPAVYKNDPIGTELMNRFLALFEAFNMGLEERIGTVTRLLDPVSAPSEFLPWLSSWFGIIQDQHWPEKRFRKFLSSAYSLFQKRGTIAVMSEIIYLYTDKSIQIIEHFRYQRPMVLGADIRVGMSSVVGLKFTKPLVIEESSTIGNFALIESEEPPEKPFLHDAYDFTIMIDGADMTPMQRSCLLRIIENEKPAQTRYRLHLGGEVAAKIGNVSVEIDSRLAHAYEPMKIGEVSSLGINTILGTRHTLHGLYGARSTLATDFILH
ncbi:hypothetical protein JW979_15165 [bacterium]|nr:hypothetical protein [candidate division CSSED10-310 bacterium]